MSISVPTSLEHALQLLSSEPEHTVLAGGTDSMVAINYGHLRPTRVLSLRRVDELRGWRRIEDQLTIGAGLRYREMLDPEFSALAPGLAQASRTVGSPQIRSTGTIGGNVATASPAGDTLPVLAALDATCTIASSRGERSQSIHDFITGVKKTSLMPDELLVDIRIPVANGPQEYLKIGTRNAMVIAVASAALVVDYEAKTIACALGSVAPVPLRCRAAEALVISEVDWNQRRIDDPRVFETFGSMCSDAAEPIDDQRATAAYRRHGVSVLARRALMRAFS